jgi:hypothetical protein
MLDRTDTAGLGHNNPPGPIDSAKETMDTLSRWLGQHPAIENDTAARAAKAEADRAKAALDDMERERDGLVRPLNTQVAEINGRYKPVRTALERLADELRKRLGAYARALEIERVRQAEAARQAAEEAERLAREAEAREREVFDDAEHGVVVDLAEAATAADTAFAAFQKADRTAARAERDSHIRITGGTGKAMGLRDREILTVTDWQAAITELGLTDNIRDAILTAARAYRKAFHELPEGITASYERGL